MRIIFRSVQIFTILSLFIAFPIYAEDVKDVKSVRFNIQLYSQKMEFELPLTWKLASKGQIPTGFLIELVPTDETIKSWSNLFSIMALKGSASSGDMSLMANKIAQGFVKICPKSAIFSDFGLTKIDGYVTNLSVVGCAILPSGDEFGAKKGQSELYYYMHMKGDKDVYVLYKSIRADGFDRLKSYDQVDDLVASFSSFLPVKLCKIEGHKAECNK